MPRDIRVGDKVRLLGWEGMLEGFGFTPKMAELAGTIVTVGDIISPYDEPYIKVNHWAWPLSSVEPLDAPRPSAWTKTSEGKPDVGVWVLSLYIEAVRGTDYAPYAVLRLGADGQWHEDPEHNGDTFLEPNYWQPLPAPPEVSK